MKPILLLDVDGVIINFNRAFIACAEAVGVIPPWKFPHSWEPDTWSISDSMWLTSIQRARVWDGMSTHLDAKDMHAYEGAIKGVSKLLETAEVYFVSFPIYANPTWEYGRHLWFKSCFGEEAADRLIFTKHKHVVYGDVLVDDKLEHIEEWTKQWGRVGVLWPRKYNRIATDALPKGSVRPASTDWNWLVSFVGHVGRRTVHSYSYKVGDADVIETREPAEADS